MLFRSVYCSLQYYYSKDKIIPFEEVGQEVFFRGRKSVDSFLLDMLAPLPSYRSDVKYMVSVCKAIYLRKIIEDNQLRFVSEKVVASEDMFFHVRYLKLAENVGFIPEYFYNYFQNECSITHTYTEDKIERLKRFIQEMHSVFAEYFAEEDYWVRLQRKALHYLRNSLYIKYQIVKKKSFSIQNYELKQILDIYKKVIYRIKNRSNKYKCPYCGEYLIKDYEYIYDNGTKIEEYKCFQHYYTYQTTIKQ